MSDEILGPDSFGGSDFPDGHPLPNSNGKEMKFPLGLQVKAMFAAPVHVAVICPPQAAITLLLNKFAKEGGIFVVMQSLPMQVGAVAKANGQPNIQIYPLLIFSIQQKKFEEWMKCKYEEVCMYQMEDILNNEIGYGQTQRN